MKILYVGGIYFVEYSLYRESLNNPNLTVKFCTNDGFPELFTAVTTRSGVRSAADIDRIKSEFDPDLTLFRNFCVRTEAMIKPEDVLWMQELQPKLDSGSRGVPWSPNKNAKHVAYLSKPMAEETQQHWLPYCVSKYWGRQDDVERDIPVMVATNIPPLNTGGGLKIKSCDILVKPILEWDVSKIHVFSGFYGGFNRVPYLACLPKKQFSHLQETQMLSRAQIYISPTSIWHDPGWISYKVFEGMACGATVLTNRYCDIEDMVGKDGDTILYANTAEETLEKVRYYLDHPQECRAIGERAYEFIHTRYGWEQHLSRLCSELKKG